MSLYPCLSGVQFIWQHLCGLLGQFETVELPYEIIANIFSRLPAETVFISSRGCKPLVALTRNASFVDTLMSRATPVIVYQYYLGHRYFVEKSDAKTAAKSVQVVKLYFTDGATKKVETKRIEIDLGHVPGLEKYVPLLYGSYNGFLLFINLWLDSVLYIWNPVTQERVTVIAQHNWCRVRGFYFHNTSNEYRVLFVHLKPGESYFQYFIHSLRTKSSRRIMDYFSVPSAYTNPVMLNDVLYWKVDDSSYKLAHGVKSNCLNSIVLFDVNSEEFSTLSHPKVVFCRGRCYWREDHFSTRLTEKEGLLCLLYATSGADVAVWVLEDNINKVWVKTHVIKRPFGGPGGFMQVAPMHFYKEELLLTPCRRNLFLYNMQEDTRRRVGEKCSDYSLFVSSACHINTLVSLRTDSMV